MDLLGAADDLPLLHPLRLRDVVSRSRNFHSFVSLLSCASKQVSDSMNYPPEYTSSGGSPQYVLTGSTSTAYTLTGLTNGTAYTVRVAAVNFTAGDYSSVDRNRAARLNKWNRVAQRLHRRPQNHQGQREGLHRC